MCTASLLRAGKPLVLALSFFVSMVCLGAGSDARADEAEWLKSAFANRGPSTAMKLGATQSGRKARRTKKGVEVASLGGFTPTAAYTTSEPTVPSLGPSLSGGGAVRWVASSSCLDGALHSVIASLASFGTVTVSSTCRSHSHNRRVGGARKSHHLTGNAVDFRLRGNVRGAMVYLRSSGVVGGLKHYGGGLFHIDTGPRRSW